MKINKKIPTILMENCGFDPTFFNGIEEYIYVYQKNPMKKVFSSNAILAIPISEEELFNKGQKKISYVAEDKETYEKEEFNRIINNNDLCIKNNNQITIKNNSAFKENPDLNMLIQNINNDIIDNNHLLDIYKLKNKSKFSKIYDINSINIQGKMKYKLFHKCCYPGCNRTFSSSGWLKAHYKEHLKQIKNSQFSHLFRKLIYKNEKENYKEEVHKEHNNKNIFFVINKGQK